MQQWNGRQHGTHNLDVQYMPYWHAFNIIPCKVSVRARSLQISLATAQQLTSIERQGSSAAHAAARMIYGVWNHWLVQHCACVNGSLQQQIMIVHMELTLQAFCSDFIRMLVRLRS